MIIIIACFAQTIVGQASTVNIINTIIVWRVFVRLMN